MGIPSVRLKTLVFQVVDGCMCNGCLKKVGKVLQNHGSFSIDFDAGEGKLTIQGSNVDPGMVITELDKIKKRVESITEDHLALNQIEIEGQEIRVLKDNVCLVVDKPIQIEEKTIMHEKEVFNDKANSVVGSLRPSPNQVIASTTLSVVSHSCYNIYHEHELELKDYEKRFTCNGCKEQGFKTGYRCKHCDYELHEDCKDPKPTVSHDFFEGLNFKFSLEKPICSHFCRVHTKSCAACGNEIHGYNYHCEDKDVYLHPMCVNFTGKLCIDGEPYVLRTKATFKCFWCNESENGTTSGWSYVSESNKAQLHVKCIADMAHETWKEKATGGSDDAYKLVLQKIIHLGLVKNKNRSRLSRGGKLLKMIMVFARTILGIILGDPTVILASTAVELFKK